MGKPIDMEQTGCELIIHDHDHQIGVTTAGCRDVDTSSPKIYSIRVHIEEIILLHLPLSEIPYA